VQKLCRQRLETGHRKAAALAVLRAGRAEAARSLISTRRPQNGKSGGFPVAGL